MVLFTCLLALAMASVHVAAGRLRSLETRRRSRWLSVAGGVSAAYVFVHLLPELDKHQESVLEGGGALAFLEHHVYLMALAGLVAYYGVERHARVARRDEDEGAFLRHVFWVHMASFAAYNATIGYLLIHGSGETVRDVLLFALALSLHFVGNDLALRAHHFDTYHRWGRWILAGAVLAGWALGLAIDLRREAVALLFAFVSGGIVLNVLKEELPEDKESRFGAFAVGAAAYTVLLLVV